MSEELEQKQSFERFGDDLSQVILSYLPIDQKLRFECLSKQIQRLIFNGHNCLIISDNDYTFGHKLIDTYHKYGFEIKYQEFESCLKKLKNLRALRIDDYLETNPRLLRIIADNCHHLRRLTIWLGPEISDESIEYLGRQCGSNLQSLAITGVPQSVKHLLTFVPQLVSLQLSSLDSTLLVNSDNEKLLPRLREIAFSYWSDEDLTKLKDSYGNQLQVLRFNKEIVLNGVEHLVRFASVASGFPNLKRLETVFITLFDNLPRHKFAELERLFDQLGAKCRQLPPEQPVDDGRGVYWFPDDHSDDYFNSYLSDESGC